MMPWRRERRITAAIIVLAMNSNTLRLAMKYQVCELQYTNILFRPSRIYHQWSTDEVPQLQEWSYSAPGLAIEMCRR